MTVVAALALGVAGCGSSTQESQADKFASQAESESKNPPAAQDTAPVKATKVTPGPGEGDISTKPKIPKQTGAEPKQLVAQDLIVGNGPEVKSGDQASVQYVGVLYKNGKEFDSSWKRNQPFQFQVGGGQVIQGWDQGVVGMKVGGRRRLIIPPDLGYGASGSPPSIPANATLVFDIDLKKVNGKG
jgi:FKBP-type peptidyl-prolyl cis-trans isomerase